MRENPSCEGWRVADHPTVASGPETACAAPGFCYFLLYMLNAALSIYFGDSESQSRPGLPSYCMPIREASFWWHMKLRSVNSTESVDPQYMYW